LKGLAWLVLAGLVVEVYLAGAALFGVTTFQPHRALGVALALGILLLLVLALVARPGRRVVGLAALLAALTVAYRDFRHAVPFVMQVWMFATPSIYMPMSTLAESRWASVLPLNPAFGFVQNFRLALLGRPLDLYSLAVSGAVSVGILIVGCLYFRRVENNFADII